MAKGANTYVTVPLSSDDLKAWQTRIKAAQDGNKDRLPGWQRNLDRYHAQPLTTAPSADTAVVPKDYSFTEQKKANLFLNVPKVTLTALQPALEDAVSLFEQVLNQKLGAKGVNILPQVDECLLDVLCPAGIAAIVVGYTNVTDGQKPVVVGEQPVEMPQPPGTVLGLSPAPTMMQPIIAQAPNIVYEEYFASRISPAKLLIPSEFTGNDYDRAPWLGFRFAMPAQAAIKQFNLDPDTKGKAQDDELLSTDKASQTSNDLVFGTAIYYKPYLYDPNEKHPLKLRELVLVDDEDEPKIHRDLPWQTFENGRFVGGVDKFPIRILTLRPDADSAYPKSDCAMSRTLVDELCKGRTQMIRQRDQSIPMRLVDVGRAPELKGKLDQNVYQATIELDSLDANNPPVKAVELAHYPQEDFTFNTIIDRDVDETWAMGPNQRGLQYETGKSATEASFVQGSSNKRLKKETNRVLQWFTGCVEVLGALLQLYADDEDYVEVVGPDGVKRLQAWDKTRIQGKFAYDVKPDVLADLDTLTDMKQALGLYQMTAQDPHVNRAELLKALYRKHHLDAERLIVAQLPPRPPDAPNISYRFSGEDLDPTGARFPIVMEILRQGGIQISPNAIQAAQQHAAAQSTLLTGSALAANDTGQGAPPPSSQHGGPAEQVQPLSKHAMQATGGMQGMPGGGMQSAGMGRTMEERGGGNGQMR